MATVFSTCCQTDLLNLVSFTLQLPPCLLLDIFEEVVLQEGHKALLTLALVCTTFRDLVSSDDFRRRAHFQWLNSKCVYNCAMMCVLQMMSFLCLVWLNRVVLFGSNYFFLYTRVTTWSGYSAEYRKEFYKMYSIDTCRGCGRLYRNSPPRYIHFQKE